MEEISKTGCKDRRNILRFNIHPAEFRISVVEHFFLLTKPLPANGIQTINHVLSSSHPASLKSDIYLFTLLSQDSLHPAVGPVVPLFFLLHFLSFPPFLLKQSTLSRHQSIFCRLHSSHSPLSSLLTPQFYQWSLRHPDSSGLPTSFSSFPPL